MRDSALKQASSWSDPLQLSLVSEKSSCATAL